MIELFKSLTKEEVKLLGKFVRSPFFNSYNTIIKIYEYFYSKYPDINEDDMKSRAISDYVYGKKRGNKVQVRKLLSDFTKVMEMFLIQLEINNKPLENRIMLLTSLRKRKLKKRFEANYNYIEDIQSKLSIRDKNFYLRQINLEMESQKMYSALTNRERVSSNIQNISNNIDYYFMISKLYNFLDMNTLEVDQLNFLPFKKDYYDEIQDYFEKNRETLEKYHIDIIIIYYAFKMFVTKEEKYLTQLIRYFDAHWKQFTKDQLFDYYKVLENSYQILSSEAMASEKYSNKKFRVFEKIYGDKYFFKEIFGKEGINMTEFVRVVKNGLNMKKYKWVINFIENYHIYLPEDFKNDIYNYSKAEYFYETGQYDKSLECINNINFKDEQYYYLSKFILLKIYYDRDEIEALKYAVNNLNKYCREKKSLFKPHVVRIKTFLKFLLEIVRIRNIPAKELDVNISVLRKELEKTQLTFSYKKWLMKKLDELEEKKLKGIVK